MTNNSAARMEGVNFFMVSKPLYQEGDRALADRGESFGVSIRKRCEPFGSINKIGEAYQNEYTNEVSKPPQKKNWKYKQH